MWRFARVATSDTDTERGVAQDMELLRQLTGVIAECAHQQKTVKGNLDVWTKSSTTALHIRGDGDASLFSDSGVGRGSSGG